MSTGPWSEIQELIATRIYRALPTRGRPIRQAELARLASRKNLTVTPATVRALTPLVEAKAREAGKYINRPVYGSNTYSLTRTPWGAARTMIQRWRHVVARLRNDTTMEGMLRALTECHDRDVERMAQRCLDSYLDLLERDDRLRLDMNALSEVLDRILREGATVSQTT